MENRRPLRVQRKEDILKLRSEPEPESLGGMETDEESEEGTQTVSEEELRPVARKKAALAPTRSYLVLPLLVLLYAGYMHHVYRKCNTSIERVELANRTLQQKIDEMEFLLQSKYKEVDVADFLEGARVIYDLTTPPFEKKRWNLKVLKGHGGEMAIDKVCTKGHCYSFNGSEGKLALAFKNEKIIKKIGISHPIFDSRSSAIKNFTVDCLVHNQEQRVGEFEYEIPGDPFQQFAIPPTKCTGLVIRVKSNHGNKEYTCIYKVHAFE